MDGARESSGDEAQVSRQEIIRRFARLRRKLVETGTRNRLVHVNRKNTRGNALNIVNERSDDVFALLSGDRVMHFLATGTDREEDREGVEISAAPEEVAEERYTDNNLETRLGPNALAKKLLKIAREARTAEEESGINVMYLALGFLSWYEDGHSDMPREAPLILLPVELVRNAKTSTYDLRRREEELPTNLPLQQRLKEDFGLTLPAVEPGEDWKPSDYFHQVAEVIARQSRWSIDENGLQLGFYSFNKLLMFHDLNPEEWPNDALSHHGLVQGLLCRGFTPEESLFPKNQKLDDILPPEKLFHIVDADASQAKVIEEVRAGRNLVVQGPPGTGKSQTITNIIAAAVNDGKRVLFLAEKMAALSVVYDRLVRAGLRDICLELHSRTANKNSVLLEISRTLRNGAAVPDMPEGPEALHGKRDHLNQIAELLHQPIGTSGETPYSVLGRQSLYIGKGYPPPFTDTDKLINMTRAQETGFCNALKTYAALICETGKIERHPFEGVGNLTLQPVDLSRLKRDLATTQAATSALAGAMENACKAIHLKGDVRLRALPALNDLLSRLEGLPKGAAAQALRMLQQKDLPRLQEFLHAGATWRTRTESVRPVFADAAFQTRAGHLRAPLIAGTTSFFARLGGRYRNASRELAGLMRQPIPKTAAERVARIDQLVEIARLEADWQADQTWCGEVLGTDWRGQKTEFSRLEAIADWCVRLRQASLEAPAEALTALAADAAKLKVLQENLTAMEPAFRVPFARLQKQLQLAPDTFDVEGEPEGMEGTPLRTIAARLGEMATHTERYASWQKLSMLRKALHGADLGPLEEKVRSGALDGKAAATELRYARAEKLWKHALVTLPGLNTISLEKRRNLAESFKQLEKQQFADNVQTVLARHLGQLPQGAMGEMAIIRGEIAKKRNHLSLRKLFATAGGAIQRIKPVLLMSPISVAQYLTPGKISFDLLVIDEASQVRPEDALGAIARAAQIVVVGDEKQLPPTNFFDRLMADDTDEEAEDNATDGTATPLQGAAEADEMESVLKLCEARGLPARMLEWHYRSRDPSLITVSNQEFYDGRLILPPSPLQKDPSCGLSFHQVPGVYDRGKKRDNRIEGLAIVDAVAEHARKNSTLSLGIVTFSSSQKNLITELLEFRRRKDPELDAFLQEGKSENVFVKNLENVQGDERDVILVSVGYGPQIPGGRLISQSFGPVNREGGERRLNVLFTRARVRCEIFASFDPGDIDVQRTQSKGVRVLHHFLSYAKNGTSPAEVQAGSRGADSPFEEDVADVIRSFGYLADPQVGSAGFRIDMGIRHPDRPDTYILAVECDGATYHSALWARERDRLRQEVLEHLGWKFYRIWSTDWFYNRAAEIRRLQSALEEARTAAAHGITITGANREKLTVAPVDTSAPEAGLPEAEPHRMPAYVRAEVTANEAGEPDLAPAAELIRLVREIVTAEGPLHEEEAARRIAAAFGKTKAGAKINRCTLTALQTAQRQDADLCHNGPFWFTRAQAENPPVRDRSAESGATLKAAYISDMEIRAALDIAREDNVGGTTEDYLHAITRLLGYKRAGQDLKKRIAGVIEAADSAADTSTSPKKTLEPA